MLSVCLSVCLSACLTLASGVLVVLDESGEAEVSDFTHQIFSNQDVGSAQVSVDVVHPLNVRHPSCNLLETQTACYHYRIPQKPNNLRHYNNAIII